MPDQTSEASVGIPLQPERSFYDRRTAWTAVWYHKAKTNLEKNPNRRGPSRSVKDCSIEPGVDFPTYVFYYHDYRVSILTPVASVLYLHSYTKISIVCAASLSRAQVAYSRSSRNYLASQSLPLSYIVQDREPGVAISFVPCGIPTTGTWSFLLTAR